YAQHGISRAGDVKNLPARCAAFDAGLTDARVRHLETRRGNRHVSRGRFLKDAHSLFAARDNHGATAKMREQRAPRLFNRFFILQCVRHEPSCFHKVADNCARSPMRKEPRLLWAYEYGHIFLMALFEYALGKGICNYSF